MLKKAVIFFLFILLFAIGVARPASAKTDAPTSVSSESQAATEEGAMEDEQNVVAVEYVLPYPGILPDHPLFAIKKLRDWIFEQLISDPLRKTEFYILQADKRLSMALAFMDKSKPEGALTSVADAQEFMGQALKTASSARASGQEIPGYILDRFERSIAKHIEVIEGMTLQGGEQFRTALEAFKTFVQQAEALK
jgi:hypothetical protein